MKTYRQIRQSLTEVGADREEDQNFKLGPDKMSPTPSDEDEYDELDDDIEDTHQEVDAIRPVYVRDKLGYYTHASKVVSSSGTMAQMTQQAATKNLQSEYVPEYGESLDERSLTWDEDVPLNEIGDTPRGRTKLGLYTKSAAHNLGIKSKDHGYKKGLEKAGKGPQEPSPLGGMRPADPDADETLARERRNRRVGIGRAVNRLVRLANREEYALEENAMDSLKKIVSRQTAETIKLADGSRLKVDMTTANALLGVHGALNIHNQKKMADTLNSNKAGFAKMSKFAFKQFGSRPGKVGIPNTGVQEGSLKLAKKPFDAGDNTIGPKDRARKREAKELSRRIGPGDQGGRARATGNWDDRGRGSTPARISGNQGATTQAHARDLRNKRTDYSEYTPDHGETLDELSRGLKARYREASKADLADTKSAINRGPRSQYSTHGRRGTLGDYVELKRRQRNRETGIKRAETSEYTPDHGETFAEDDANANRINANRIAARAAIQKRVDASRKRGGLTSAGHRDMTGRIAAGKHDPKIKGPKGPKRAGPKYHRAGPKYHWDGRPGKLGRPENSEYTPDHGETFAEGSPEDRIRRASKFYRSKLNQTGPRGGASRKNRASLDTPTMAQSGFGSGKRPTQSSSQNPSGSYSRGEQQAARVRAAANRAKRAAARRGGPAEEYVREASDEKEYDNYPWTKGDLSPEQVRAKLDLAKKIAKKNSRKRKSGKTSGVKYDEKIGRG